MICDKGNDWITYREVLQGASSFLSKVNAEAAAAEWLLKEQMEWTKTDLLVHFNEKMPLEERNSFLQNIRLHASGIPVQQLVGHEWFYGRKFMVTQDTLIPRPETEELVQLVLEKASSGPKKVLDIGTGTGAIACTLKAERPEFHVTAVDISHEALAVAEENGKRLGTDIRFLQGDLTGPVQHETFDVIVSNPPYIGEEETGTLEEDVRRYEPALALFGGKEGLDIYQRLAKELPALLAPSSMVFLEIGFLQGTQVKQIFSEAFSNRRIHVLPDISGKDRMIWIEQMR